MDYRKEFRVDSGDKLRLNKLDPAYKGKFLQLELTVEDDGVFTTPWSATITYRPATGDWPEFVCAQNPHELARKSALPIADKPDF